MRVLVTGGRFYAGWEAIWRVLIELNPDVVIHGSARDPKTGWEIGADKYAGEWARYNGKQEIKRPANWSAYGRSAGSIRNKFMLENDKPDLVIHAPGGPGTRDCVKRAKAMGIPVRKV